MEYNSEDTIYFRQVSSFILILSFLCALGIDLIVVSVQARSIQELAKKDFENLREESEDDDDDDGEEEEEEEPRKVARRGRPPGKKTKTEPCPSSHETVTPSNNNGYNLRKVPTPNRFRLSETVSFAPETCPTWVSEWENEFPSKTRQTSISIFYSFASL